MPATVMMAATGITVAGMTAPVTGMATAIATTVTIVIPAAKTSSVLIMSHMTHFALIRCPVFPCSRPFGTREPPLALFCLAGRYFRRTHKFIVLKPDSLEKLFFRKILI
jgi:hypothetical protein